MEPFQDFYEDGQAQTKLIHFDYQKSNWIDLFDLIAKHPNQKFNIITIDGKNRATGSGAIRAFYSRIFEEMLETIFVKIGIHYFDFNTEHYFWSKTYAYNLFAKFIILSHCAGCKLSRHLAPSFFENVTGKKFEFEHIKAHMKRLHPDIYSSTDNLTYEQFVSAETGYDTIEDYYRYTVGKLGQPVHLYYLFKALKDTLGSSRLENLRSKFPFELDSYISAEYEIDRTLLKSFFAFHPSTSNPIYVQNLWNEFLEHLSQNEIFDMLVSLYGSLNPTGIVQIKITTNCAHPVKISTCYMILELDSKLFDNLDTLIPLKYCFMSGIKQEVTDNAIDIRFAENTDDGIFTDDLWTSSSESEPTPNHSENESSSCPLTTSTESNVEITNESSSSQSDSSNEESDNEENDSSPKRTSEAETFEKPEFQRARLRVLYSRRSYSLKMRRIRQHRRIRIQNTLLGLFHQ
jgi:hypothetical protein